VEVRRSTLRWLLPAVLGAAGAAAVAVAALGGGDGTERSTSTTAPGTPSLLSAAVERADVHVDAVTDGDLADLILELCTSSDGARLAARVVDLGVSRPADVEALVEGIGRGAEQHCPTVPADHPQLVNEAYLATLALLRGPG
jgi:hypothetical protein